jgi:hypothetical protein
VNNFQAAGWIYAVQDELTTLSRRLIGVEGYKPFDSIHDARVKLKQLADSLTTLNCRMLIDADKEAMR